MEIRRAPFVSIIMPAFNASKYIKDTIDSVIQQTYFDWELIIINDGSYDDTQAIVELIALRERRIRLFNRANSGIGSSRNFGFSQAQGDFIAFIDSDDLWMVEKLSLQMEVFSSQNDVDVVFTNGYVFYNKTSEKHNYNTITGRYSGSEMYAKQVIANYIPILSVIVKRSIIDKIGPWNEIEGCEDYDYWLRMARANATFFSLEQKLFMYRKHDTNYSNDSLKMIFTEAEVLIKNYDAKLLSNSKSTRFFKFRVHAIILSLVQIDEVSRALELLSKLRHISESIFIHAVTRLLSNKQRKSFYALKVLFKLDRMLPF